MSAHAELDRLTTGLPEAAAALAQRAERLLSALASEERGRNTTTALRLPGAEVVADHSAVRVGRIE